MSAWSSLRARLARWWREIRPARRIHTLAPADVWPDAARMAVAALLSFLASRALDLHGGYFAVLTALMTTRPSANGLAGIIDRLIGMALGVAVGLVLSTARIWHVPEEVLVAIAMVPLCFVVARFRKYQVAPITAILVLAAGPGLRFALHGALLRIGEVVLGAAIGFAVAAVVFRRTTDRRSRQHAADFLAGCGALMRAATEGGRQQRDVALRNRLRADLRLVTTTSRILRARGMVLGLPHIASLTRLQSDLISYGRALFELRRPWRARARADLDRIARAFDALCTQAAETVTDAAPMPDFRSFDAALRSLRNLLADRAPPLPDESALALPFLLLRLRADLTDLLLGYGQTEPADELIEATAAE